MRYGAWLALAVGLAVWPGGAWAWGAVPSCYAANHIQPVMPGGYTRLIYLLIDQTVGWNDELKGEIISNLNENLTPGTKFVIATFSAYAQRRYLVVVDEGVIEAPMPAGQFDNTPIAVSRVFNACLADQLPYAVRSADAAVAAALSGSSGGLGHSDILAALKAVSAVVAADTAARKILVLASDGLENSGVTSFYSRGAARDVDPLVELARAAAAGVVGDFGGASVYVIGGALPPPGEAEEYQPARMLADLARFWALYFQRSHARLVAFGEPALLDPVHD